MLGTVAVSGASGRTGFRVAEEVIHAGGSARLLLRPASTLPDSLQTCVQHRLDLADEASLDQALRGVDSLVIATGARPSIDLTGPMRVDAWGVRRQVESCRRVGVSRVVLVSSLCAGRWRRASPRANLAGFVSWWPATPRAP